MEFLIGSWIPTLGKIKLPDVVDKLLSDATYEIGDGLPHGISIQLTDFKLIKTDLLTMKLKVFAIIYNDKNQLIKNFHILSVNELHVRSDGLWWALAKWNTNSEVAMYQKSRQRIYLKLFQYLKEIFHKHKFHNEEQDALIPVLEQTATFKSVSESIVINSGLREQILNFINESYRKKFEHYVDQLNYPDFNDSLKFKLYRKALGEIAFYEHFCMICGQKRYPFDKLIEAAGKGIHTPLEIKAFILTGLGVIIGIVSLLIGIAGFVF